MEEQYVQKTINPERCKANGKNMAVEGVREDCL